MKNHELFQTVWTKLKAKGFSSCELIDTQSRLSEMQIDAGEVSLMRTNRDRSVALRGLKEQRYASVSLNQVTSETIDQGVEALIAAAQSAPEDQARAFAKPDGTSPIVLSHGPEREEVEPMYHRITEFLQTTSRDFPALKLEQCGLTFRSRVSQRLNSLGLDATEKSGEYSAMAMFSSKVGDKTSSFNYSGISTVKLDRPIMKMGAFERLIQSSVREVEHKPMTGKFKGQVIVAPECVPSFLLEGLLGHLDDSRIISGTSRLADQVGERVVSQKLNLRSDVEDSTFASRELFTSDGYRSQSIPIFEHGVLKSLLLSEYGARKTGRKRSLSSGSNLVIEPGAQSLASMIANVEKGVLVQRFSGGNPAANGDLSGVAKNSYLIENGKIVAPVSEVMITGNIFEMLNSIFAISSDSLDDGSSRMPYIGVDGVVVSGN